MSTKSKSRKVAVGITSKTRIKKNITPVQKASTVPSGKDKSRLQTVRNLIDNPPPKVEWVIDDILPVGLTILAGPPKAGKSWLILNICISLAKGELVFEHFKCKMAESIYYSFEDSDSRLRERLLNIIRNSPKHGVRWKNRIKYVTQQIDLVKDNFSELRKVMQWFPETKVIVLDTLGAACNFKVIKKTDYGNQYKLVNSLHSFAMENNICIIAVHHQSKTSTRNSIDSLYGSRGITGGADTIWLLEKDPLDSGYLEVIGRDVLHQNLDLQFEPDTCKWIFEGFIDGKKTINPNYISIIELLKTADHPLKPKVIAVKLKQNDGTIRMRLKRILKSGLGEVKKTEKGEYFIDDSNQSDLKKKDKDIKSTK